MVTDVTENQETTRKARSFKVHSLMCTKLMKLVDRILKILPRIEAARPGWSTGLQALCSLSHAINKANLLLQYCSESSKLYMALTGDAILLRCQRSQNLLEQNLCQFQDKVPVMLAVEVSRISDDLRGAKFILNPSEEEAGKAVKQLLKQRTSASDSIEDSEMITFRIAASKLHLTSTKAILIERRSIQNFLKKVNENDSTKRKILAYLLNLLKKLENSSDLEKGNSFAIEGNDSVQRSVQNGSGEIEFLDSFGHPLEFKCPISCRLMYDPVVIASGRTYERLWIQKWFDEGNDTCPETKTKLTHLSMTPNITLKDLITRWCKMHGVTILDPSRQICKLNSWENSSNSIASLGSSMNDIRFEMDLSNVSLGSLDTSYGSDSLSRSKNVKNGVSLSLKREKDLNFPGNLSELPWESQYKVIEDMEIYSKDISQVFPKLMEKNVIEQLTKFLKDAVDRKDPKAQREGSALLLALVSKNRCPDIVEDTFRIFPDLLGSRITKEVLSTLEVLSGQKSYRHKFIAGGVLRPILDFLNSDIRDYQEIALRILRNLSSDSDIHSHIVSFQCVPKLVPLFKDSDLAGNCILVLRNLSETEEARVSIAATKGCIASIAQILETDDVEDQESAVFVLLSLCLQKVQYCQLVMDEGVIPSLVNIAVNGSEKGKVGAHEMLRQLRDIDFFPEQVLYGDRLGENRDMKSDFDVKKPGSKGSRFFGRKISIFSPRRQKK